MILGSTSASFAVQEDVFSYEEWRLNCYEPFLRKTDTVGANQVTKTSLISVLDCSAGREIGRITESKVDPFAVQTRELDDKLKKAYEACKPVFDLVAKSGEVFQGDNIAQRAAISTLVFCMGAKN